MSAAPLSKLAPRTWIGLSLALGLFLAGTGPAGAEQPIPTLDQLLAQAVQRHPDIVTAKARVDLAEARLNSARLQVVREVIALRGSHDSLKAAVEKAKAQFTKSENDLVRTRRLRDSAAVDTATVEATELQAAEARQNLIDAQARLARAEVEIRQLVEQMSANAAQVGSSVAPAAAVQVPRGPIIEKIRQALDLPLNADFQGIPIKDAIDYFVDLAKIPINSDKPADKLAESVVTFRAAKITIGAGLQAIEDQSGLQFVVRDYGLLLTTRDNARKEGYLPLAEFVRTKADGSARPVAPAMKPAPAK